MPWRCAFESPSSKGGDLDPGLCDPRRPTRRTASRLYTRPESFAQAPNGRIIGSPNYCTGSTSMVEDQFVNRIGRPWKRPQPPCDSRTCCILSVTSRWDNKQSGHPAIYRRKNHTLGGQPICAAQDAWPALPPGPRAATQLLGSSGPLSEAHRFPRFPARGLFGGARMRVASTTAPKRQ